MHTEEEQTLTVDTIAVQNRKKRDFVPATITIMTVAHLQISRYQPPVNRQ